jgi:hypothetical protein
VLDGEPLGGLEIRTGSETLREVAFESCTGRPYLELSVSMLSRKSLDIELPRTLFVERLSVRG